MIVDINWLRKVGVDVTASQTFLETLGVRNETCSDLKNRLENDPYSLVSLERGTLIARMDGNVAKCLVLFKGIAIGFGKGASHQDAAEDASRRILFRLFRSLSVIWKVKSV